MTGTACSSCTNGQIRIGYPNGVQLSRPFTRRVSGVFDPNAGTNFVDVCCSSSCEEILNNFDGSSSVRVTSVTVGTTTTNTCRLQCGQTVENQFSGPFFFDSDEEGVAQGGVMEAQFIPDEE